MLASLFGVALPLVVGAASVVKPIDGAFGLDFTEPVSLEVLGASIASPKYLTLPDNLAQTTAELLTDNQTHWFYFTPDTLPAALSRADTRFTVMVDGDYRPLRIVAERQAGNCDESYPWFIDSLTRKYLTEEDPAVVPRNGFIQGARFSKDHRQVDLACGKRLLIEYTDAEGLVRWQGAQQAKTNEEKSRQTKTQQVAADIERRRHRQFADSFTLGDRFRLDGALGVAFGQPFPLPPDYVIDEPASVTLPQLPEPFATGNYQLTVGPQAQPIRLEGRLPDGSGAAFAKVRAALQAKYGPPMKNTKRHVIHRVNGNFFVLRRLERLQELNIAVIDSRAERDQRARAEATAQQRFEEATRGL